MIDPSRPDQADSRADVAGESSTVSVTVSVTAPDGIGEITEGSDLAEVIVAAASRAGGLRDGDVVVVTSKIISKAEGRMVAAGERQRAIDSETVRTVARRASMAIVETPHGLTQAAAGVDNSNVDSDSVLVLPRDPDASAARLRTGIRQLTGRRVGVVISDTAGRAWRLGQTDHAIGAAGVTVLDSYDGRHDAYGNELHVTMIAIADELASAADLVKRKLTGRPVAIVRGLAEFVHADDHEAATARDLIRPGAEDLFRMGVRESVIHAVLAALGVPDRYEAVIRIEEHAELVAAVVDGLQLQQAELALVGSLLSTVGEN